MAQCATVRILFWRSTLGNTVCFIRAREGDRGAIEAITNALSPRLTKMVHDYARRAHEDPDDLLQEAWIGLLEALKELDVRIGTPEQYLIQRAKWRLLDAIKYARVRKCAPLETSHPSYAGSIELEDDQMNAETMIACANVAAFIEQLKPIQQAVLACLLDGMTWRETGDLLGCTSANIAYHVRQIQKQYEAWEG